MPFHLEVKPGQELTIGEQVYRIAAHPMLADYAYIQEGRKAWVCQLVAENGVSQALKVFKPTYRTPLLVNLADRLKAYAELSGLAVCRRTVLSPERHKGLLKQYPDLVYAVLMPWVEGPTWMNMMQEGQSLVPEQSLRLAQALVEVLCGMEQQGLAHCDLSGPNVLLPELIQGPGIALVDVEDFYGPVLQRPPYPSAGSLGYGHKTAQQGLWYPEADRFAGAVLLGEMLGMCDGRIPSHAYQNAGEAAESYFDSAEMQQESERYALLMQVLRERWGAAVAGLFERAWQSDVLAECPTFGEWLVALPEQVPEMSVSVPDAVLVVEPKPEPSENPAVSALIAAARRMASQGDREGAVEVYRQAQALLPAESGLREELGILATDLEVPAVAAVSLQAPELSVDLQSLSFLFVEGQAAYRRKEWSRARELLSEVVRQDPEYGQEGESAQGLLRVIEDQARKTSGRRFGLRWWLITAGTGFVVLILVLAGLLNLQNSKSDNTPIPPALLTAQAVATSRMVATSQVSMTRVAIQATSLAQVSRSPATLTARGTSVASRMTGYPSRTPVPTVRPTQTPIPIPTLGDNAVRIYDFVKKASIAQWTAGPPNKVLIWAGDDTDSKGFARWVTSGNWETGDAIQGKCLEMYPKWVKDGWIDGVYLDMYTSKYFVHVGDRFRAIVGLLQSSSSGGDVTFKVMLRTEGMGNIWIAEVNDRYGDGLKTIDVNLTPYAGQRADMILEVEANGSPAQDRACWLSAFIYRYP